MTESINSPLKMLSLVLIHIMLFSTASHANRDNTAPISDVSIATPLIPPLMDTHHSLISDLVQQAYHLSGINAQFFTLPIGRIGRVFDDKKACIAIGTPAFFSGQTTLSMRVYSEHIYLFYLKSRFPEGVAFDNFQDLKPYRIGTIIGGVTHKLFKENGLESNLDLVKSSKQNVQKLHRQRIDMFLESYLAGWKTIKANYPKRAHLFSNSKKSIKTIPVDIFFDQKCTQQHDMFVQGFEKMQLNGDYQRIVSQYIDGHD
ncbi:transporter substrate-binding domain-containing protein [Vibrio profundum]